MALKPYVIKQGDYLAKLAFTMNFIADEVWKDPKNAELAKKRDPNILLPGDQLWVPDEPPPPKPMEGGTANDYSADIPTTKLKLVFADQNGPFAGEAYTVEGAPGIKPDRAGPGGEVELEIPVNVREFDLCFPDRHYSLSVQVGDMDPVEEPSGLRKRLRHLGHFRAPHVEGLSDEALSAYEQLAISSFQTASGLEPTGIMDDPTRAALVAAHGC